MLLANPPYRFQTAAWGTSRLPTFPFIFIIGAFWLPTFQAERRLPGDQNPVSSSLFTGHWSYSHQTVQQKLSCSNEFYYYR